MNDLTAAVRAIARRLLEEQKVDVVYGWVKGPAPTQSIPAFVRTAEEADRLVFDQYCIHNLSTFLLDLRDGHQRVGIFVKGCDSRGVVRLIEDRQ
ncbi:MAG: 4Fe-4S ferredoxin, partial [Syntrophomonadaceae bacterium]|nr:4Fe-4S ferredoxin [Syntrophomonadaceae bacterium]